MSPQKFDKSTHDIKSFLADDLPKYTSEFQSFWADRDRLDNLYFITIQISKYQEISFVLKLLLTFSHDQASIKRGFSLNNNILKTNMGPETVIAKQLITDHIVPSNLKPHRIEITNPILKAFKSLYSSYKIHLEEEENQFG